MPQRALRVQGREAFLSGNSLARDDAEAFVAGWHEAAGFTARHAYVRLCVECHALVALPARPLGDACRCSKCA